MTTSYYVGHPLRAAITQSELGHLLLFSYCRRLFRKEYLTSLHGIEFSNYLPLNKASNSRASLTIIHTIFSILANMQFKAIIALVSLCAYHPIPKPFNQPPVHPPDLVHPLHSDRLRIGGACT